LTGGIANASNNRPRGVGACRRAVRVGRAWAPDASVLPRVRRALLRTIASRTESHLGAATTIAVSIRQASCASDALAVVGAEHTSRNARRDALVEAALRSVRTVAVPRAALSVVRAVVASADRVDADVSVAGPRCAPGTGTGGARGSVGTRAESGRAELIVAIVAGRAVGIVLRNASHASQGVKGAKARGSNARRRAGTTDARQAACAGVQGVAVGTQAKVNVATSA